MTNANLLMYTSQGLYYVASFSDGRLEVCRKSDGKVCLEYLYSRKDNTANRIWNDTNIGPDRVEIEIALRSYLFDLGMGSQYLLT